MSLESHARTHQLASSALETLRALDVPASPENFALFYEHHSGTNPSLQRVIDTLISNQAAFNQSTLHDLHLHFLSSVKQEQAVRTASSHVLDTLQEVIKLAETSGPEAQSLQTTLHGMARRTFGDSVHTLREAIVFLVRESARMAGRTEYFGAQMHESSQKIDTLERNLESALQEASSDALTGVSNRKAFDQTIRDLAGEAMNSGEDLALILIDIDHFKQFNDTWGHQAGDAVLRHVAQTIGKVIRGQDHVARYGGEEFSVLLPRADIWAAICAAENIREALAREPLILEDAPGMQPVTVSLGAACYQPGESLADWIGRSDSALYSAKRAGRDRVMYVEQEIFDVA